MRLRKLDWASGETNEQTGAFPPLHERYLVTVNNDHRNELDRVTPNPTCFGISYSIRWHVLHYITLHSHRFHSHCNVDFK